MKQAIEKYLSVNSDILDNKYIMQHKLDKQIDSQTKVTEKQAETLSHLSNLAVKMICISRNLSLKQIFLKNIRNPLN